MGLAAKKTRQKTFLNVGCGTADRSRMLPTFQKPCWKEVRIDLDPRVNPDVVASFSDLHMVKSGMIDAIWSSHNLEHMPMFEAKRALGEAHRVLKPDGFMFLTLPDIEAVSKLIARGKLMDVAYESSVGPITALDMVFGHQSLQEQGNHYMAHRSGFSSRSLAKLIHTVGFAHVKVVHGKLFDLWALAGKQQLPENLICELHDQRV